MNKDDFDLEVVSEVEIRNGLEQLVNWARNLETMSFGQLKEPFPKDDKELSSIWADLESGFKQIDRTIFGYEILVDEARLTKLAEEYAREEVVYRAGKKCYRELIARFSKLEKYSRWFNNPST